MSGGAFGAPSFGLGKLLTLSRFLPGKATLLVLVATAARARIIASRFWPSWSMTLAEKDASVVFNPAGRRHIP
jgi:hypothetical protein